MLHGYSEKIGGGKEMIEIVNPIIYAGEIMSFKPADNHVMAMELEDGLKEGDTVEVTLTVAGGDKQSFTAEVLAPGQGELEE